MNIIEAIMTGRPVKRPHWDTYYFIRNIKGYAAPAGIYPAHTEVPGAGKINCIILEDVLADDWEFEEEKLTITENDLILAMQYWRENTERHSYWHCLKRALEPAIGAK